MALWIGCSDSRVIPEQITQAEAGELFVVRNVANVVPPWGMPGNAVGAAIEYAVLHLKVPHIVVCGHTECGGIKALDGHVDANREPQIAQWIELALPAYTEVKAARMPPDSRYVETIKANVLLQSRNLMTYPCVADAVKASQVAIHSWLYDVHSGELLEHSDPSGQWRAVGLFGS